MPKTICLLEDDRDIREMITYILEADGYAVSSSGTVGHFRQILENYRPDLFLLDIMLPDGNGIDVCKCLKGSLEFSSTPVLLMSAGQFSASQTGQANDFIRKPFDIDTLRNSVDRLCA